MGGEVPKEEKIKQKKLNKVMNKVFVIILCVVTLVLFGIVVTTVLVSHNHDIKTLRQHTKEYNKDEIMKEQNLAEKFRKIIDNMSDEELNQKLKELEPLNNIGPKADEYLKFLEENRINQ